MVAAGLEPAKPKPLIYSQFPLPLGYATEDGVKDFPLQAEHCSSFHHVPSPRWRDDGGNHE